MFYKNRFKALVVEKGIPMKEIADKLGICYSTFNSKLNRNGDFNRDELIIIKNVLNLSPAEVHSIFFE